MFLLACAVESYELPSQKEPVEQQEFSAALSFSTPTGFPTPENASYADCPIFAPVDQVGLEKNWERPGHGCYDLRVDWEWTTTSLGEGEHDGWKIFWTEEKGQSQDRNCDYLISWSRKIAWSCEEDGMHLVYEEWQHSVTSHGEHEEEERATEFPYHPLVVPRTLEVDTSWKMRGVSWPTQPDLPTVATDSYYEHIGRGFEEKETQAGVFDAFRMKMMTSENTYEYYWLEEELGLVIDLNGDEVIGVERP
jgi:hypothetical protein